MPSTPSPPPLSQHMHDQGHRTATERSASLSDPIAPSDATAGRSSARAIAPTPLSKPIPIIAKTTRQESKKPAKNEKTAPRKFTIQHEEQLIAAWGDCVHEYYAGIRKNVIKRIRKEVNTLVMKEPFFNDRQILNKLAYMEKRYKEIRDEFSASGYGVMQMGEGSLKITVERKFPLFFSVHEIIGSRTNIEPEYVVDAGGQDVVDGSQVALTTSGTRSSSAGAVVIGSDGEANEEKEAVQSSAKKRNTSSSSGPKNSVTESLLSSIENQSAADERQHQSMMVVMRGELLVSQAELEMKKHAAENESRKCKAEGLRKLAEMHMSLGNKGKATQILCDAHDILSKM